jgi:hypothetical protein
MPKKTSAARNAAQRQKTKTQKSFELVKPVTPVNLSEETAEEQEKSTVISAVEEPVEEVPTTASARVAARRQATQRAQRSVQSLISAEHFTYVSRDLITVAILAILMLAIIITLYFTIGRTL